MCSDSHSTRSSTAISVASTCIVARHPGSGNIRTKSGLHEPQCLVASRHKRKHTDRRTHRIENGVFCVEKVIKTSRGQRPMTAPKNSPVDVYKIGRVSRACPGHGWIIRCFMFESCILLYTCVARGDNASVVKREQGDRHKVVK